MNRALFQPELVSLEEALKVCKKPRAGETLFDDHPLSISWSILSLKANLFI
jgi:hypothetical protein